MIQNNIDNSKLNQNELLNRSKSKRSIPQSGGFKMPKIAKKNKNDATQSRKRNNKSSNTKEVSTIPHPYANYYGNKVQEFLELNPQQSVRGLIEQMCTKENKYVKQYVKEDFIPRNDFIFDLRKTHKLKIDKQTGKLYSNESDDFLLK